ncbi:MAG: rod shape-determining protein MreD [Nocardioidaceae bacterium]
MRALRVAAYVGLLALAVVVQVSVFGYLSVDGVAPDLALLVVVAGAAVRGAEFGAVLGFCAGLLLDLAPPADHVAGRWALALVVVGYLAGRLKGDLDRSAVAWVATVAGSAFVGTSLFALSGLVARDPSAPVGEALRVIAISVGYDVLLTPLLLPVLVRLFRRLRPPALAF